MAKLKNKQKQAFKKMVLSAFAGSVSGLIGGFVVTSLMGGVLYLAGPYFYDMDLIVIFWILGMAFGSLVGGIFGGILGLRK